MISTAAERYAIEHEGAHPVNVDELKIWMPQASDYCGKTVQGFTYTCDLSSAGYTFTARPTEKEVTTTNTITTGGVLSSIPE